MKEHLAEHLTMENTSGQVEKMEEEKPTKEVRGDWLYSQQAQKVQSSQEQQVVLKRGGTNSFKYRTGADKEVYKCLLRAIEGVGRVVTYNTLEIPGSKGRRGEEG